MWLRDATLPDGSRRDVRVDGERIGAVVPAGTGGGTSVDLDGRLLMPGGIDAHVHFREPGAPHKETWATGSRAAAAGGVTTVVDQPNTDPPTVDGDAVRSKAALAAADAVVDFGINGGVTEGWRPEALFDAPITALGEVFLADSTGELGIDLALFERALAAAADRAVLVSVHAEDAARFDPDVRDRADAAAWSDYRPAAAEIEATRRACSLADAHDAALHLAHASTPEAIDLAVGAGATCEVTPHHLLLSRDDLEELGTLGRMNPPLRSEGRRRGVLERVVDGTATMVASDHAPHTLEEKRRDVWHAPSGVPGVETMVPLLLGLVDGDRMTPADVARLVARNPATRFGLADKGRIQPGADADLAVYDLDRVDRVDPGRLHTACGWTPFEGRPAVFPEATLLRGGVAYRDPSSDLAFDDAVDAVGFGPPRGRNVAG